MKIQFLINSLTSGGAERVAVNLFNNLSKEHSIYFYTILKDKYYKLNKNIKYESLTIISENNGNILFFIAITISFFIYLFKTLKNKPDLLISFLEISNFLNIMAGKLVKTKTIISVRTNPLLMYPNNTLYGKYHNLLIKLLYPRADKVIVVSKEIENILIKCYKIPKGNIKTIYNPHDINLYLKLSKEPFEDVYKELFEDSFVFINIGRLTEAKGQWFLIRAFKKVVDNYPNTKLIILGEGELRGKLEELINKLNLQNNVYLLGLQSNPFKFLKHSHCFVFPSLWEGFPNVLVESLSLNIPVISTDCKTGPREILCPEIDIDEDINYPYYGKYGILTKPFPREMIFKSLNEKPLIDEENMLADLMINIIENEELRKRYSNGLERALDFNVDNIINEWEKLFKEIL
ncbi:Glycosyl transferase group 1 [Methanocaldococcus lauensis]|uniref:Glycosyl transferase group 1 n=1 Tax=Methanocaldococcus lauensis TaxID=2546128 RepID=A0A8D6PZE7_9EURY|nr:glycosyltransferase [Methanocaldococcus lauensis]CAB3290109.1 Glycosyl transferase group 1 [Methanocaldococcus lauensis]